jgi:hypothetical protein
MRLAVALFASAGLCGVDAASFQVFVDVSDAPNAQPYAGPVKALFENWYPKINDVLFGKGAPLPFKEVRAIFKRTLEIDTGSGPQEVPAYAKGNIIFVNFAYLGRMSDDYRAMLIHELTHVSQNYTGLSKSPARWLGEGIADYVRHKYFEKDLMPKLVWDSDGTLKDSDLDKAGLEKRGYLIGYTIAAPFLYWLELQKNREIVRSLSQDIRDSRYSTDVFQERCGASLDALWQEFLTQKP